MVRSQWSSGQEIFTPEKAGKGRKTLDNCVLFRRFTAFDTCQIRGEPGFACQRVRVPNWAVVIKRAQLQSSTGAKEHSPRKV